MNIPTLSFSELCVRRVSRQYRRGNEERTFGRVGNVFDSLGDGGNLISGSVVDFEGEFWGGKRSQFGGRGRIENYDDGTDLLQSGTEWRDEHDVGSGGVRTYGHDDFDRVERVEAEIGGEG